MERFYVWVVIEIKNDDFIFRRKVENFNLYYERLKHNKNLNIILPKEGSGFIPFRVAVVFNDKGAEVAEFLTDNGIETRTFFYPLHKQPCYATGQNKDINFSSSIELFEHGLCFPVYPDLTKEQIDYICDKIEQFYERAP